MLYYKIMEQILEFQFFGICYLIEGQRSDVEIKLQSHDKVHS
jgi:hypothetical protein